MRQELWSKRMTEWGRDINQPWCRSNSRGCSRHWCNLTQVHRLRRRAWLVSDRRQGCWCTDSLLCCLPWEKPLWRDLVQSQSLAEGRKMENEWSYCYVSRPFTPSPSLPSIPPLFLFLPYPSSSSSPFKCLVEMLWLFNLQYSSSVFEPTNQIKEPWYYNKVLVRGSVLSSWTPMAALQILQGFSQTLPHLSRVQTINPALKHKLN